MRWSWRRASAVVSIGMMICVVSHPPLVGASHLRKTGSLTAELDINANWTTTGPAPGGGVFYPCKGTYRDKELKRGTVVRVRVRRRSRVYYWVRLTAGTSGPATQADYWFPPNAGPAGKPANSETATGIPEVCEFKLSLTGLPVSRYYYVTVPSAHLGPYKFRGSGGRRATRAVVVDRSTMAPPTTNPPTTTAPTTAPPTGDTVVVTGTGTSASSIAVLVGGQESEHNDVSLPFSMPVPWGHGIVVTAQTADGSSTASITCHIDGSDGAELVSNTSTGPYAVVTCTTSIQY